MITRVLKKSLISSVTGWRQPAHLIFHVTSRCNAHCGMCFAWQRLNKDRDLSLVEIEKVARELPNLLFLDLSGGEPFLRNDLAEILTIFEKYSPGVYVNLPTNGLLAAKIEEETRRILAKTSLPLSLNLSLDGLEKTHDRIRGVKGSFVKLQLTFKKLAEVKKNDPRLSLKVVTVVSNQNFEELERLVSFVENEMVGVDFHALTFIRGQPADKNFALPSLKEIDKKRELFFDTWDYYGYTKSLGKLGSKTANIAHRYLFDLYLRTLRERKMAFPCLAGQSQAVVYANGDLAFCELLPPIGNLRKVNFDFQKLWWSKKAERQRQRISQNKCFCTHGCVWTDNLFFNPRTYPRILWELGRSFCP